MKISAFQLESSDKEGRINFWQLNDVTVLNENLESLDRFDVLFWHTSDYPDIIKNRKAAFNNYKGWKIAYTGGKYESINIDTIGKVVNTLSWTILKNSYEIFKNNIAEGKSIPNSVEAMIGFDPDIEECLEKLATIPPFEEMWNSELRNIKHELQKIITKKMSK